MNCAEFSLDNFIDNVFIWEERKGSEFDSISLRTSLTNHFIFKYGQIIKHNSFYFIIEKYHFSLCSNQKEEEFSSLILFLNQLFLSIPIQQTFSLTLYNQTFLFFYSQKSSTQTIFILNWRRQILFFPTQIFDSITNCTSIIGIWCFFLIILSPTINFSYFFN